MRTAILGKVREYRWELWLFLGIPVIADTVQFGTVRGLPSSDWTGVHYATWLLSNYGMWLVLLGIPYRWVHRSGRDILRLAWQYSLAVVPLSVVFTLTQFWVYGIRFERLGLEEGDIDPSWICLLWWAWRLATLAVLVWFARRASRDGFDKALVLIGVMVFPGVDFLVGYGRGIQYEATVTTISVLLSFVAIWALHRVDAGRPVGKKVIWALFGTAVVAYIAPLAVQDIEDSFSYVPSVIDPLYGWLYGIIPLAVAYGITVLAAYLIRVRCRNGESLPKGPAGPSTSNCCGG